MARHRREVRKVPVKDVGLGIDSIGSEDLETLAGLAEDAVRKELENALPSRSDYIITSTVELRGGSILVTFDISVSSAEPLPPEDEALLEKAIDRGLSAVENELMQKYRRVRD